LDWRKRSDQQALEHILSREKWLGAWEAVRRQAGPDFDPDSEGDVWRQKMWCGVVQMQGVYGLELIGSQGGRGVISAEWGGRLREMRLAVEKLKEPPRANKYGPDDMPGSDYPDMYEEVSLCW
jgi:hypothetical protein